MINKALIVGRVGKDPEIKYTQDGKAVANLSVATNETWKSQGGEKKERTEWHRCVFFGRVAEIIEQYVKKGALVGIEGKLQTRSWEKDGITRYSTEIIGDKMHMLGGGKSSQNGNNDYTPKDADEDIPF